MTTENLASLIIASVSAFIALVFFLLLRVINSPIKRWYLDYVARTNEVGEKHPIKIFKLIDIPFTIIYEGMIFGLCYLWGLGFLPCSIACSLFIFYRLFFYRQLLTSVFVGIFQDHRSTKADKTVDLLGVIFLLIFVILVVVPILNLVAKAFSNGAFNSQVTFAPIGFTWYAFNYVFQNTVFWKCFLNSIIITASVTVFSNIFMGMAGYCLSKRDFPLRSFFMIFFVVTMLFSAGIIPIYLLMSSLGLLNTIWSVILISINNVFNMLLYKTAFENVPSEVEESAEIDGCSSLQLFFQIMVPMILPTVASCCFFSIVGSWNGYGAALMFINDESAMPLSLYIYRLLSNAATSVTDPTLLINYPNIQAASIIISVIPILCIYPYVIRYIKSGIMIGSVKG